MAINPYESYKQQGIMTASPMTLVLMLYDGCIKQLKLSRIHIQQKNYEGANNALQLAQDIVTELTMSLDMRYEISKQLMSLYDFLVYAIVDVNMTKDAGKIEPLLEILTDLRDAWDQVSRANRVSVKMEE